tara:strand:+ start:2143 stop:3903 length:1761 start_codon:yes stop_codon:yes gene_type:complete
MKFLKKLIQFLHPYLKNLYPSMVVNFIFGVSSQVLAIALTPYYYQKIIDALNSGVDSIEKIYELGLYAVIVFVLTTILFRLTDYTLIPIQARISRTLDAKVFSNFLSKDFHFYQNNFSGSLVSKFSKFSRAVTTIYDMVLHGIVGPLIGLVFVLIVLGRESLLLFGIFGVWSLLYLFSSIYWSKKRSKTSLQRTLAFSQLTGRLSDGVSNISQVKSFGSKIEEKELFQVFNERHNSFLQKDWYAYVHGLSSGSMINIIFQASVVFMGIYLWNKNIISLGVFVLLLLYIRVLMARIRHLGRSLPNLTAAFSDTREVINIVETPVTVTDSKAVQQSARKDKFNLTFKNLSFTYPNGEHVFEDFSLEIPEGQKIGIVGKSGSGKTSIVKLLLRFYDPDAGLVQVGDTNIKNMQQDFYRQNFLAFVPQETSLFHRTLRENIMYGNPDADDDLFNEVVNSSYVAEFADDLPNGYETKVGERGIRLSGGQRQRVGIARAMMKKDAPILIMDEATSALDSKSEQFIQDSFEKLSEGRTTIVIAHRLSTIQKMDRIIVMDKGKIIEDGTHAELLAKNGHYAELWNSQVGGFISE